MNYLPNQPLTSKVKHFINRLSKTQVKGKYNLSLSFFRDQNERIPYAVHSTGNSVKVSALKLIAILSIIALVASLIFSFSSLRRR